MKQIVLFLFTMTSFIGFSQNNSLNVFSQDGDPFFVIINGEKHNPEPETNVTVDGLNKDVMYKVKVVFADGVIPDADKNIFFEKDNQLMTTSIDKKIKNGKVAKVKIRYAGITDKEVTSTAATYDNNTTGTANNTETYNNNNTYNTGTTSTNMNTGNTNAGTSTTTTSTSTTTTTNNGTNGGSVNVNVTDPNTGENINMGINVNVSGDGTSANTSTNSSSSTTTTTYSSTTTSNAGNVNTNTNTQQNNSNHNTSGYNENVPTYVPGYEGAIGCNNVLVNENDILEAIENESFSDDKMMILKQATKSKCVSADQVVSFMGKFDFEENQLEAAKFLYEKTYDQDNYFKVISALEFSSSKEELQKHIDNSSVNNSGYNSNVPTYVPGYTGSIGCNNVLINDGEIQKAMEEESFSEDKMMVLKQATKTKCVSTDQVLSLLDQFSFSEDKLEAAKYLYDRTYDKDNYYKVTNSFTFSSTKEELNEYIEGR